jgi:hypothetical protein
MVMDRFDLVTEKGTAWETSPPLDVRLMPRPIFRYCNRPTYLRTKPRSTAKAAIACSSPMEGALRQHGSDSPAHRNPRLTAKAIASHILLIDKTIGSVLKSS